MDLADLGAAELVRGYAAGHFSPVEVLAAVHRRIDAVESILNGLYAPDPRAAQAAARDSERRWRAGQPLGPLDGVPATVKENIATPGVPVPLGTAGTELVPALADAPAAARLRESGAVLFAKTVMPDYGMLSSGVSSLHPTARNPWNPLWSPGGSSAGAAVAAAAGYGPLHVGTDIGGSIRLPAGWTAVVGLKPSFGRVPVDPPYHGRVAGPLTARAADAALLMSVLSRPDWRDHTSLPEQDIAWQALDTDVRGLRIGLHTDAGCGLPVHDEVAAALDAAARLFEAAGAHVEPLAPFFTAEMLHDLDLFWRVRGWNDLRALSHERQAAVLPFIADWCRGGADVPGTTVLRCVNRMLEVSAATVAATQPYDYVISPVSPVPTFPAEWPMPTNDVTRPMEHIGFTVPYNMSGQPAASVNCGFTADGRPIGLQVAGRRFDDLGVLRVVHWYEGARPGTATPAWPPPAVARQLSHL
jgi:aspartyl-tRNA(Asn)/glutamyl-tRNA(Gln) amidotransferase subunit A